LCHIGHAFDKGIARVHAEDTRRSAKKFRLPALSMAPHGYSMELFPGSHRIFFRN